MTELVPLAPKRKIGTSRRALTGRVALGGSQSIAFESSLERDWLLLLDFEPQVTALQVQPFELYHEVDGQRRRYTPDVLAVWERPDRIESVVYEVKFRDDLRENWQTYRPRFVAATRYCRERGWRFKVVNDRHIRTPRLHSVKFLRQYLRFDIDEAIRGRLLATLDALGTANARQLLDAAFASPPERLRALPYLWKLVAGFEILTDLNQPLNMLSSLRSGT